MIRTYRELRSLETFEDRFKYLSLRGKVGKATFGYDRDLNQQFYRSTQWRNLRNQIIFRDLGCDLGIEGYEIHKGLYIHHMNPLTVEAISHGDPDILNPEYLITTTHQTHNAIHYGNGELLVKPFVERRAGDTQLWSRREDHHEHPLEPRTAPARTRSVAQPAAGRRRRHPGE